MSAFTNHNQLIAASGLGRIQRLKFDKVLPSTTVANVPHTVWTANGVPAPGSLGGPATEYVDYDKNTIGALPYTNPTGGRTMHLVGFVVATTGTGTIMLVDKITAVKLNHNHPTTLNFSPQPNATNRLRTGEGCMIFVEVTSALSAASNTRTFSYTNQSGTSGRTTQDMVTVASAIVGRVPYADSVWVGLQSGDTGVRSLQSVTLVTGTATGSYNISLVRSLCPPVPVGTGSVAGMREMVVEIPSLPQVFDDSCLSMIFIPMGAGTFSFHGEVILAEN